MLTKRNKKSKEHWIFMNFEIIPMQRESP